MDAILNGFVEIWGGVRSCGIYQYSDKSLHVYIDDDLHDGIEVFDEFIDEIDNKLYAFLDDYKAGKSINVREWRDSLEHSSP